MWPSFVWSSSDLIGEQSADIVADKVKRLIVCSGKVYYDLVKTRTEKKASDVAIIRVEQLRSDRRAKRRHRGGQGQAPDRLLRQGLLRPSQDPHREEGQRCGHHSCGAAPI